MTTWRRSASPVRDLQSERRPLAPENIAGFSSISHSLLAGEIDLERAVELARAPEIRAELTLGVVCGMGEAARGAAAEGRWRNPLPVSLLLVSALEADEERADLRLQVAVA